MQTAASSTGDDAPLPAALSSLLQMMRSEVEHEMTQEATSTGTTSSTGSGDDIASRVMHRAQDWPRTHAQFHKLDALNCPDAEAALESEQQMADLLRRLDRMQQPPSPSAAAAAAAAASSASTVAAAASSPAVAALPAQSAYVSSISSTGGFHSLFSSSAALLPSYDSLLDCCAALSFQPLVGAPSHLALLSSALEMPLGDILASPQWAQVLPALAGCAVWGRKCSPDPAIAAAVAANAAAAAASPTPQQHGRAASRKKSQGSNNSSASHSSHSHKKFAAAPSKSKPVHSAVPVAVPVSAPAPDVREEFLLACTALRALQGLYEAAEGSVQTAEIYLALVGALKATIARNPHAAAGEGGALSFLAVLPASSSSSAAAAATEISLLSPALFLPSLFFHSARLWSHMSHSVLDLSPHFSEEITAEIMARTGELVASMLGTMQAAASSSPAASSSSSGVSLFWTLFGMQDPRAIWLRKWVSQFNIRALWHRPPASAPAAAKKGDQASATLVRATDDAFKRCKEYAAQLALHPAVASPSPAAPVPVASDGVLSLSSLDSHALAHTAAFGFLFEHLTSWLPPTPAVATPVAAASPTAAAAAAKGASKGGKKAAPSGKQSLIAAAALPVVSCGVHDAEQAHADTMRSMRELASHMLLAAALHFDPPPTTTTTAATSASLTATAPPSLLVRTRLTLLSCCHRFLAHSISSADAIDAPDAVSKEAAWLQALLQQSFHALLSKGSAVREAQANTREFFSKMLAANATAAAAASPTANGSSNGKKGSSAATQQQQRQQQQQPANRAASKKSVAAASDDKRRSIEPIAPASSSSSLSSGDNDGPATNLEQQAALTAILGLALGFALQSPLHRAALVDGASFASLSRDAANKGEDREAINLRHFLCQLLGFDGASSSSSAAATDSRRRIEFFDGVGAAVCSSAFSSNSLPLPSAVEAMMVDLLRQCIVAPPRASPTSSLEDNSELQFRCVHGLASRIEALVESLPPALQAASSEPAATIDEADAAASCPHQQSARITMLLDLLSHWVCALPGGWDRLHASHPRVLDLCVRRFVLSLRTQSTPSCLPWCVRCVAATTASVGSSSAPSPPDSFLTILPLSRALRRMVLSAPTFRALVRQGLVHDLLARIAGRLKEEEGRWGLAFELASSADGDDACSEQPQEQEEGLWSLRMLITALGHPHALSLLVDEIATLQSSTVSPGSFVATALRPPLFLMLSSLVRSCVALEDFVDDEATAAAEAAKEAGEMDGAAMDGVALKLGSGGAMQLPLSFSSLSPLLPAALAGSLPASWSPLLSLFSSVASSSNALEIGLRLLYGLVRAERGFAPCMQRWWSLEEIVRRSSICGSSSDGQDIEDQSSAWRRKLIAALGRR